MRPNASHERGCQLHGALHGPVRLARPGLGSSMISSLFMFLKHSGDSAVAQLVMTVWGCGSVITLLKFCCMTQDTVSGTRMSEQLIGRLQDRTDPYLQKVPGLERLACLKRARAFRPLCTAIGDLTGFSLPVTVGVCDEIF